MFPCPQPAVSYKYMLLPFTMQLTHPIHLPAFPCPQPAVSYEYVACQRDNAGVLILSEFAGAAQSLGKWLVGAYWVLGSWVGSRFAWL